MSKESLTIRGKEYFPTSEQWSEYRRIDERWKDECNAVYASCAPHVPGALDGNDVGDKVRVLTEKYLDEIETMLVG